MPRKSGKSHRKRKNNRTIKGGVNEDTAQEIATTIAEEQPSKKEIKSQITETIQDAIDNIPEMTDDNFFYSEMISTCPNIDLKYKEKGVFHTTASMGVNFFRSIGTSFSNLFGGSGFDVAIADQLRTKLLENITTKLKEMQSKVGRPVKLCNLRFEIEAPSETQNSWYMHCYATLYEKI